MESKAGDGRRFLKTKTDKRNRSIFISFEFDKEEPL